METALTVYCCFYLNYLKNPAWEAVNVFIRNLTESWNSAKLSLIVRCNLFSTLTAMMNLSSASLQSFIWPDTKAKFYLSTEKNPTWILSQWYNFLNFFQKILKIDIMYHCKRKTVIHCESVYHTQKLFQTETKKKKKKFEENQEKMQLSRAQTYVKTIFKKM